MFAELVEHPSVITVEVDEQQIRAVVDLRYPNGNLVPELVVHIDGSKAWFRWHDKPFQT